MVIKAGTYRFNDVLSAPSATVVQQINFVTLERTVEDGSGDTWQLSCSAIAAGAYEGNFSALQFEGYELVNGEPYDGSVDTWTVWDLGYGWDTMNHQTDGAITADFVQTITIPTDSEVSAEFYEWFTANAVEVVEETPIASIQYNGSTIANLFAGQKATLACEGMKMASDVVVETAEVKEVLLQEKTATENGEVVADAGYDGLSKVTVAVEGSGGASIDGGYAVTFMADGTEYEISSVAAGGSLSAPQIPQKDGWYFVGWYTAEADGEAVSFPYTPAGNVTLFARFTETVVLGFTGLSESSGALAWTDDIKETASYTVAENGAYTAVTSPLDDMFPFCDIEEFTDSSGNVFVKYPKCWIKFITNSSGVIDGFKVSNVQAEEDMFIPDCFLNPADEGATYLDYFALGKYEMSGSTTKGYSKSGATCLVNITRADARSAARAYGSATDFYKGYQMEDLSMLTLYNFLCMLYYKTANIQTVFGGRTGKGGTSSWSAASATGSCDNIQGLNGWNTITDCVKMLGIENPYGNIGKWIDGVYFSEGTIYAHRLPQNFADSSSGASSLGFSRPTSSSYISALKQGTGGATKSYAYASAASGSETTYVGDYCYYNSSGVVLVCGGSWNRAGKAGLWYLRGNASASYSLSDIGARLSFRPL